MTYGTSSRGIGIRHIAPLPDVLLVQPQHFTDHRGSFRELVHRDRLAAAGISIDVVQINHSRSIRNVIRGLHFQHPAGQAKLVAVVTGRIFDVAVDVRVGSLTFGRWSAHELTAEGGEQMYLPEGFAHGFLALSEVADVVYACTTPYSAEAEHSLAWDDPQLRIGWPLASLTPGGDAFPLLSDKDRSAPSLATLEARGTLPRFLPSRS